MEVLLNESEPVFSAGLKVVSVFSFLLLYFQIRNSLHDLIAILFNLCLPFVAMCLHCCLNCQHKDNFFSKNREGITLLKQTANIKKKLENV